MRNKVDSVFVNEDALADERTGDAFVDTMLKTSTRTAELENRGWAGHLFTIILFVLFIVVLLLAILIGTSVFSSLRTADNQIEDSRLSLVLIPNIIRATDEANAVSDIAGPEGRVLVLTERLDTGTYETRIFLHDGQIVQQYAMAGSRLDPDSADPIVASDTFEFSLKNGILTVTTDDGETSVAMRSLVGVE